MQEQYSMLSVKELNEVLQNEFDIDGKVKHLDKKL